MIAEFEDLSGLSDGFRLDLEQLPATLGRAGDVTVRLTNALVSRRHCEIDVVGRQLVVRDLGALNPTLLNDHPVVESQLFAGDRLKIGLQTFLVRHVHVSAMEKLHSDFSDDSLVERHHAV